MQRLRLSHFRLVAGRHGADVDARDSVANTPLHIAAGRGNLGAVQLLVTLGADVHLINDNGDTPQSLAEREAHSEIATFLSEVADREEWPLE